MRSLHIDIETYCEIDLKKAGAYRYAEAVELLLFGFKYDDEPTQCLDILSGDRIPQQVLDDLINPAVKKEAFNAAFEISQLESILGVELPVKQWECSAARAAMCGLPLNLEQAVAVLNLEHQKDKSGYALIRYFCIPCKPTKTNGMRTRNLPEHAPEKWQQFIAYCKKDVEAEWALSQALQFYQISEFEHDQWCLDTEINKRGIGINIPFVRNAITLAHHYEERLFAEAREITGLDNPKSVAQLKKWLFQETEEEVTSLNKESIPAILKKTDSEAVRRVLEIRQEGSKTSIKKYPRMLECVCADGRVRGVHQYYGANRTGRQCLAENSLVLIKNEHGIYEKKIQDVLLTDLVFDGDEWVSHEGVVFSGDKEVITHDNVCATERHIVYLDSTTSLPLKLAQEQNLQLWRGNIQFTRSQAHQENTILDSQRLPLESDG